MAGEDGRYVRHELDCGTKRLRQQRRGQLLSRTQARYVILSQDWEAAGGLVTEFIFNQQPSRLFVLFSPEGIMKTPRLLGLALLAASHLVIVASPAHAQSCKPIQFKRGHYSGTVRGIAPPEDGVCYEVRTGAGQSADVRVDGRNVIFSIPGVVEVQERYSFTTEKKTYRILVSQLMRSVTDEPFSLTVSVR
jgi:hypothetical protein